MVFASPAWLLLLVIVATLAAAYLVVLACRRRDVLRFTALALLDRVRPARPTWLRHVPTAAVLLALGTLTVGLAGPTVDGLVPRDRAAVVLVLDVSLSMTAVDVAPTRLAAAQVAAREFVRDLPPELNIGLVTFAGTAAVLVQPTTERGPVERAIDTARPAESTATGEAIFTALRSVETFGATVPGDGPPPAHVVLLTDGKQNVPDGPGAEDLPRGSFTAARAASAAGVPVSAIAFGTPYGTIDIDGEQVAVPPDTPAVQEIARISGGRAFTALTGDALRAVYRDLRSEVGFEPAKVDVSRSWFVAGTLGLVLGMGMAVGTGRRIP